MPDTQRLFRLQQVDSQLDRLRARLAEIDRILSEDESLRLAEAARQEAQSLLNARSRELKAAEALVHEQRIKIEQSEAALYGSKGRSPKELQDLQKEVAALRRHQSTLEDRQLEGMEAAEGAEAALAAAERTYHSAQAQHAEKSAGLNGEREGLLRDQSRLEVERQAALGGMLPADLALYDSLRKTRKGVAVARVTNKACSACGSVLNTVLLQATRTPGQISRCTSCGRILYGG